MAARQMNRRTMGNDFGGRRAENPVGAPRVTSTDVKAAALIAGVQVKRESAGWCMWWILKPGDVWRTLAATNFQALRSLNQMAPTK